MKNNHHITHNESVFGNRTHEYVSWSCMRRRCLGKNHKYYLLYGGRGIAICERWNSYENFLSDMGRAPSSKHTLERIDVNGNYEPRNCKWATRKEQGSNRRNTIYVTYKGEVKSLITWCEELGIDRGKVYRRWFYSNIPYEQSFNQLSK